MGKVGSSAMLVTANQYLEKLSAFAETTKLEFDKYQQTCVSNAVRAIYGVVGKSKYELEDFNVDNVVEVLQQTAFLRLNPSAIPSECYFIVRNNYDKTNKKWLAPTLEFGIEGAGNDVVLQKFGRNVDKIKSYIVYKDDDFTPGYMNGWEMVLPKYQRTFKTNIPEKVVYLIKKRDGEVDVQYADTNDVKKSLLANAKQNGADKKLLRELNKLGLYEILNDDKWLDYKIKKTYGGNTTETPLFNPSYTDPSGQANMIERKLRNHATRKYPKDFNQKEIATLYEKTFEDVDSLKEVERVEPKEVVDEAVTEVVEQGNQKELIVDDKRPTLDVVEDTAEETVETVEENPKEPQVTEEPKTEEEPKATGDNWFD